MGEKKKGGGALFGAAFLMATSAIGPGFLTQTAKFTGQHGASFGFVILASLILSAIAQINIWRVLCISGLRGQDVANKVLPALRNAGTWISGKWTAVKNAPILKTVTLP